MIASLEIGTLLVGESSSKAHVMSKYEPDNKLSYSGNTWQTQSPIFSNLL